MCGVKMCLPSLALLLLVGLGLLSLVVQAQYYYDDYGSSYGSRGDGNYSSHYL